MIVVLNQEIHLHKPQNTTSCLAQPIITTVVYQNLDRLFSTSAGQSWNKKIDLAHPPNSCRSDPRSFSTSAGQSQNKKALPSPLLTHARTSIHTYTSIHTHILCAHTYTHACTCIYAHTYTHTHTHTYIHTTHTHTHTHIHTNTNTHTKIYRREEERGR